MADTRGSPDSIGSGASSASARSPGPRDSVSRGSAGVPPRGSFPALIPLGEHLGKPELPLDRPVTTVGSRETCRLRLASRTVSKAHALMIRSKDGRILAADLASRTGILVNGQRVGFGPLRTGDRVQIGKFTFRFRAAPGAADDASPPAPGPAAALGLSDGSASLDLPGQVFLIGRRPNADLPLTDDPSVSAAHAVLFAIDGVWHVRDLNSRTGTRLNGKPIHQHPIAFGDTLQIGSASFQFHAAATEIGETPAPIETVEPAEPAELSLDELAVEEAGADGAGADGADVDGARVEQAGVEQAGVEEEPVAVAAAEVPEPPPPPPEPVGDDFGLDLLPESAGAGAAVADADLAGLVFDEPASPAGLEPGEQASEANAPEAATPAANDAVPAEDAPIPLDLSPLDDATAAPPVQMSAVVSGGAAIELAGDEPSAAPTSEAPVMDEPSGDEPAPAPIGIDTEAGGIAPEASDWETPISATAVIPPPLDEPVAPEAGVEELPAAPPPPPPPEVEEAGPQIPVTKGRRRKQAVAKPPAVKKPAARRRGKAGKTEPLAVEPAEEAGEEAEAGAEAAIERTEPTEPTPESALPLEPAFNLGDEAAEVSAAALAVGTPESLSDTAFGRAVEAFADPSTGPLSEAPAPQRMHPPVPEAEHETVPDAAADTAAAMLRELDQIGQDEEFVAIPEAEPVADEAWAAMGAFDAGLAAESLVPGQEKVPHEPVAADVPEPVAMSEELADAPVATPPPLDVDEAELLPAEASPAPAASEPDAPVQQVPAIAPPPSSSDSLMLDDSSAAPAGAGAEGGVEARGPSIFGFNFDGGSFLGGMALRLPTPAPESPPAAAPGVPSAVSPTPAPTAEAAMSTLEQAEDAAPAATTVSDLAGADVGGNVAAAGAAGPVSVTSSEAPPLMQALSPTPLTEEAPAPAAPLSAPGIPPPQEAGLHAPGDEEQGSPIPTLEGEMVVPPLTRPFRTPPANRRAHTTAFDGLSASPDAPGEALRVTGLIGGVSVVTPPPGGRAGTGAGGRAGAPGAEAFSQLAPQISVEVFGSLQGNPDEFIIPEVGEPEPPGGPIPQPPEDLLAPDAGGAAARPRARGTRPAMMPAGSRLSGPVPVDPPAIQKRHLPVSVLLGLMVLCLAAVWVAVYLVVPPRSKVTGTLSFANLDMQNEPARRAFMSQQLERLHGQDVRTVAKDLLVVQRVDPGFLDNSTRLDEKISADGAVHFEGNSLILSVAAFAQEEGRAQVNALLLALSKKDADLTDAQKRAQRHLDAAQQSVTEADAALKALREAHRAEQKRGDDRPDPSEIAALEAAANRSARLLAVAHAARVDAESTITDLRSASTTQPADPVADPELVRLHWQLNDLNGQIKDLAAKAPGNAPAANTANGPADGGAGAGAAAADNATAAPDVSASRDAGFLQKLQDQVSSISHQISDRETALAEDQTFTPAQRERAHQKQLEDLGVQLADLKRTEALASTAAAESGTRLQQAYTRLDNARAATLHIDQLISEINVAQGQLKQKSDDAKAAQDELAGCVTVAAEPQVSSVELSDPRPVTAGVLSGVTLMVFCLMILSASRSMGDASGAAAESDDANPPQLPGDPIDDLSPMAGISRSTGDSPPAAPASAPPVEVEEAV
jgi:pSer/pThr/pTyr-binding forkhead associated (FHA) protein